MSIKDWPADERPREKLLQKGAMALSDAELLAIFLRTGLPGLSAVELARTLLNDFGSLKALMKAPLAQFCQGKGLGAAKYVQLQAVMELSQRCMLQSLQHEAVFTEPALVKRYLSQQLGSASREVFQVLFLDNQHRLLKSEPLFYGTIDASPVYPRVVVQQALTYNAAAVILAHNHPSGVAEPSRADRSITERLQQALQLVDIRLLDHLVVGDGEVVSFAERGWL
ncbi:DNA repair protein RadC [Alkalimonas collagenimarina]|uniref:DNA repair protein RadC n=1 Tax=Alkalimonas collagenimarina TaxID=400390 RepID=A0ABT9GWH7_9GAMM|nr:DNA repair protein RadC [Alkalimonas collagenimarina]MDP4535224.1 DNA repair protein RadC [Alkalimonas collagenimarina]